jgi:hypothetical protein
MRKKSCNFKIVDTMLICLAVSVTAPGCNPPETDFDDSKDTPPDNGPPVSPDSDSDTRFDTSPSDESPVDSDSDSDTDSDTDSDSDSDTEDKSPDSDSDKTSEPSEPDDSDSSCTCECICDAGPDSDTAPGEDLDSDTTGAEAPGEVCLMISEYIEGSSWNKGVEIYNCGQENVSLDGISLCIYTNNSVKCSAALDLTGNLAADQVMTVCHSNAEDLGACDMKSGAVNFSGDDRIALMQKDIIIDAFGELAVRPENSPWADITLRRCNLTPYSGDTAFDIGKYFSAADTDDFSDFGRAPAQSTCE